MKKLIALLLLSLVAGTSASESKFTKFVYRDADKIMDENGVLRFISFNVPCLHYSEDNLPFTEMNPWRLPNEFEINDASNQSGKWAVMSSAFTRFPSKGPATTPISHAT